MKNLLVSLVIFLGLARLAPAQTQALHAEGLASYSAGVLIPFPAANLAPETPVHVGVTIDATFWYSVTNLGPAIDGYQFGRGITYTFHSSAGQVTRQLCNNYCGGSIANGETKESLLIFTDVPSFPLDYVHTAAEIPYALELESYGAMQSWGTFSAPQITGAGRKPFRLASRNGAGVTLHVTPL